MIFEEKDNLEQKTLNKNEQQKLLIKKIRDKSIYDFLKNNSSLKQKAHNHFTDRMKYVTFQMLDKINEALAKKLEEPTWKDKIDWKEDDLLYNYNPVKVIVAEEAKVMELTLK